MWQHNYDPLNNAVLSTLVAALPIFVLLLLIGILRKPAWMSALAGLAAGLIVAIAAYGMPVKLALSSSLMGAAFGLLPIGWIVYWAVVLYRITLETGNFEIIKDSIGGLTTDRRLQAMLIAFAFGAFVEGAAGFGTPVAVAAAMLTGLGFSPFFAAGICLLANTAPVAFGSIGIPVTTLANTTGIPEAELSAWVGRICAPISVFIPAYLVLVMGGLKGLKGVLPAAIVVGVCFASVQLTVSNLIGPQLVDILAALTAIVGLVVLLKVWNRRTISCSSASTPPSRCRNNTRSAARCWPGRPTCCSSHSCSCGATQTRRPSWRKLRSRSRGPACTTKSRACRRPLPHPRRMAPCSTSSGSWPPARRARSRRWPRRSCCGCPS
jgi:lactate permease